MQISIVKEYEALSRAAAEVVAEQIRSVPDAVVGFATGSTPLGLYRHLVRLHQNEGLDFSRITCFNLDEYLGLPFQHEQSYHYFMWQNLFNHVNVHPQSVYIPSGTCKDPRQFCAWYEQQIAKAGGIDLQILGLGENGHLAFNEPGASLGSRTRVTVLTQDTIHANARFFDHPDDVPREAITMGIGTIMEARKLLLLARGKKKAKAVSAMVEGALSSMMPASALQMHPEAVVILDEAAAAALTYYHHDGIAEPFPQGATVHQNAQHD